MNLKEYRHIIWDFNGTLLDDSWLCAEVVDQMLDRRGKTPLGLETYRRLFDLPLEKFYTRIGFDLASESFEAVATEFINAYDARRRECSLQAGAQQALEGFQRAGLKQSVLSAYELPRLESALKSLAITGYFETFIGMEHHRGGSKAHLGKEFMKNLKNHPAEVLFIGDTIHDYEVASQMQVDCVLIAQGHHTQDRLRTTGAKVFDSLEEILDLEAAD